MEYLAGTADVAVIGAGHAGVEAALACARLGCNTVLFTISNDAVANMPCNPSIGGTGKGQLPTKSCFRTESSIQAKDLRYSQNVFRQTDDFIRA